MRILFLTQWFDPEPMFKGLPFARALHERGHRVQVLTGFPNYPEGKLYPGYRLRLLQREMMDGIEVVRLPLFPSHDASPLRRIANYASFALAASTLGPWVVREADVMYVYHPPATVALPAAAVRLLRGVPFVYDVQDLWPDTLAATGLVGSRLVLRMADAWCRLAYRMAGRIVVLSPGFKRALVQRGVPAEKIEVIYNWCPEDAEREAPRDEALAAELGFTGRFNVLFSGTMGKAQALQTVLEAARLLLAKLPAARFVMVGGGVEVEDLKRRASEMRLDNVVFLPRRPFSEIGKLLALADVLFVHLRDDPLFEITIPSKTQAYLAAGRPILMAVRGDAAALVERAGAGLVCPPEDPEALAGAVVALHAMPRQALEKMGEAGRSFYCREMSLASGVERFERALSSVTRGNPANARESGPA